MKKMNLAAVYAIAAAALYAVNVPLSKMLLHYAEPTMMAAFLYLGAGVGMFLYGLICMPIPIPIFTFMERIATRMNTSTRKAIGQ